MTIPNIRNLTYSYHNTNMYESYESIVSSTRIIKRNQLFIRERNQSFPLALAEMLAVLSNCEH